MLPASWQDGCFAPGCRGEGHARQQRYAGEGWPTRPRCARGLILAVGLAWPAAALPPGFTLEPIGSGWNQAVGMTFRSDGGMYVWERGAPQSASATAVASAVPVHRVAEHRDGPTAYPCARART